MQLGETVNLFSRKGRKFVTVFLAEGNTKDANGVGLADSYLEEFGRQMVADRIGHTALAYPTAGHPKWKNAPLSLVQSGNTTAIASFYKRQAEDNRIGTYISTFVKKIPETGKRRLLGTFEITDPVYQKMWDEKKFPRWNSTSLYELERNREGFITKAIPIDNCSVNDPHYGIQRAGIYHVCDGDKAEECISQAQQIIIKQSGGICSLCKNSSAQLFTEFFNANNPLIELQEILQSGDLTEESSNPSTTDVTNNQSAAEGEKTLPDTTQTKVVVEENKEGKEVTNKEKQSQQEGEERDWKAYAKELEQTLMSSKKDVDENYVSKKEFAKLTKELRLNKINAALGNLRKQLPTLFKDDDDFASKVAVFNNLKMTDDEVLEHIARTNEMYLPIIKENKKLSQSGNLTPYGIDVDSITNNLKSSGQQDDNNKQKVITVGDL